MNARLDGRLRRLLVVAAFVGFGSYGGWVAEAHAASKVQADFNGDGWADLAVGAPHETVGEIFRAGAVNIIYGSVGGLTTQDNQIWTQGAANVASFQTQGIAESGDYFGSALAAGDFNGDGYDDLAVGVPREGVGSVNSAGAVNIIYGSPRGLAPFNNQIWTQTAPGVASLQTKGNAEPTDWFGSVLAAGDFNGDRRDDLAIGVPLESVGDRRSEADFILAGAVNVIYGSVNGLDPAGNQIWTQTAPGVDSLQVRGDVKELNSFGRALAVGNFDGDRHDDLAIGVTGQESKNGAQGAGAVNIIYGAPDGLAVARNQSWSRDSDFIEGSPREGDYFGSALAAGDFNGDAQDDLAIGVPTDDLGEAKNAGSVNILWGVNDIGLTAVESQLLTQHAPEIASLSIEGIAETDDRFGSSLVAGDFNGDGRDALVIGVPGEDVGTLVDAGAVNIVYGAAPGATPAGSEIWTQEADVNSKQVPAKAESGDHFGEFVTTGDFDGNGLDDLAVGVPREAVGEVKGAGAINVLYATGGPAPQVWTQEANGNDSMQTIGVAEECDSFGVVQHSGLAQPQC